MKALRDMKRTLLLGVGLLPGLDGTMAQGPLTPASPPAPMMRTLQQVEPRIPIESLPFVIAQPGSYYLAANLEGVSGQHGIVIGADYVTIDLMGFAVRGVPGSLDGIRVSGLRESITVRNGYVTGWGQAGIRFHDSSAPPPSFSRYGVVENVQLFNNGTIGIVSGLDGIVRDCLLIGHDVGISGRSGIVIEGNIVRDSATDGIVVMDASRVTGNRVINAGGRGIYIDGVNCEILANEVFDSGVGLSVRAGNRAADNIVKGNATNYAFGNNCQIDLILSEIPQTISWPARVTLAGTLRGVSGTNGITVASDNVHIDLGGHTLVGVAGSANGIEVTGARTNFVVRNGAVRGWGASGIRATGAVGARMEQVAAYLNTGSGFWPGRGALLRECIAQGNQHGITISPSSRHVTLVDLQILENSVHGINASNAEGLSVRGGSIAGNGSFGIDTGSGSGNSVESVSVLRNDSVGISIGSGGQVINCVVSANVGSGIAGQSRVIVKNCTVTANGSFGIHITGSGGIITECTVNFNDGAGISASSNVLVLNNVANSNGQGGGNVGGIRLLNQGNRVEGNMMVNNPIGLDASSGSATHNLIIGNTARGNTTNFVIRSDNKVGVIVSAPLSGAISGDTGGAGVGTSNPWSNISY